MWGYIYPHIHAPNTLYALHPISIVYHYYMDRDANTIILMEILRAKDNAMHLITDKIVVIHQTKSP